MPSCSIPYARSLAYVLAMAAVSATLIAGCATTAVAPSPEAPPAPADGGKASQPSNAEPPPPNVNLSGFPLTYRQGYADGCASAAGGERKDTTRFAADGNYRTGWQDGLAICRKR
jgi:hypothetical protein